MELPIQTPALLFPAVSLLMLAYTNKFLAIANLIRKLYSEYEDGQHSKPNATLLGQIANLSRRLNLIRWMQALGIASVLFCVICMFCIYEGWQIWAKALFAISLLLMIASLFLSLIETFLSAGALKLLLRNLEK